MFLLCLKIFFARILDVTLGTIKTVHIVNGNKLKSTIIAFFEVLIWFDIARTALNTDVDSIIIPIVYSAGYATGTYIGMLINSNLKKKV